MKSRFVQFAAVAFISANVALAAATLPHWASERVVDKIMDWGDRHIHGPFTKGGGDEKATRQVVSAFVSPGKAWKAFYDITIGGESGTATAEQDTPGDSQKQGVPLPAGTHVQVPIGQPQPTPTQPVVTVNPEIHPSTPEPKREATQHEGGGIFVPDRANSPTPSSGTETASNTSTGRPEAAGSSQPSPSQTTLESGKTTMMQAPQSPNDIVFHPNPELATGSGQTTPAPTPAATPVPAQTPANGGNGGVGSQTNGRTNAMIEKSVTPALPKEVGATPVPSSRPTKESEPGAQGGGGAKGGGDTKGGWTGGDHPEHFAKDTA
jgi:hypothetical protein